MRARCACVLLVKNDVNFAHVIVYAAIRAETRIIMSTEYLAECQRTRSERWSTERGRRVAQTRVCAFGLLLWLFCIFCTWLECESPV